MEELETVARSVPGNNYEFTQPIQMRMNELISGVRADVAIKVNGDDLDTLNRLAARIADIARDVPGAADVRVEETTGLPMLVVNPDRQALSRYGLNARDVQRTVSTAVGGTVAGQFIEGDRRADIVVRLPEQLRQSPEWLADLPIPRAEQGNEDEVSRGANWAGGEPQFVPLREVARIEESTGPNQVNRENGKRRVVVTANVRDRDLGGFVAEVRERLDAGLRAPPGYWIEYGGTFEQLVSAAQRLSVVVPVALVIILALLFFAFGSMRAGVAIFSGVPLALTGGVLALWLRDIPLSISAGVGFIALVGRGRVERSRHGRPDPHARAKRTDARRSDRQRRDGATARGVGDRAGGFARLPADGAQCRARCGSAASAGDGGDRRHRLVDVADAYRAAWTLSIAVAAPAGEVGEKRSSGNVALSITV